MSQRILLFLLGVPFCALLWRTSLHSGSPSGQGAAQSQESIRFEFGGDVAEIPAQFIENLIFLPVRINDGSASLFELDSSAAVTSIAPSRAKELNLDTGRPASSSDSFSAIANCVLTLPGLEIRMDSLPVMARSDFSSQFGRTYEGEIGQDFLHRVIVQVDYARKSVQIRDASTFKYPADGRSFPLTFAGGMPIIRARFELLKGGGREGDFGINTALDASVVVGDQFAERHHVFSSHGRPVQALVPAWNQDEDVELARLKFFRIGPYSVENSIVAFSQEEWNTGKGFKLDGEIGSGMLRHFTVIFDYPHKRLILNPNASYQDEDQEDKSGLSLIARGPSLHTFEVVRVLPGSPAAEAGIQKGDIISGIDNDAAADLTLIDIRELFREVGHEYKVLIERKGQPITVTIKMQRLL